MGCLAVDDAVDLADIFTFELQLVKPEGVYLVLSGTPQKTESEVRLRKLEAAGVHRYKADQSSIYAVLDRAAQVAGPEGLLLISFATHGFRTHAGQVLLAADSLPRFAMETGVAIEKILDLASSTRTPRRLVFLDACRDRLTHLSRPATPDPRAATSPVSIEVIAASEGSAILYAARRNGYAYSCPDIPGHSCRGNGVFSWAILDGLNCGSLRIPQVSSRSDC